MDSRLKSVEDVSKHSENECTDLKKKVEGAIKMFDEMMTKTTTAHNDHTKLVSSVRADTLNVQARKYNACCVSTGKKYPHFQKHLRIRILHLPTIVLASIFLTSSSRPTSRNSATGITSSMAMNETCGILAHDNTAEHRRKVFKFITKHHDSAYF